MTAPQSRGRCAIYTRKSSEEGLEQSFNSLHAQREACEAYILSQKHEGWQALAATYDDGGFSGGNMERPGLKKLLVDISAGKVDTVVVYKVDRLTRSLSDFARIVESFTGLSISETRMLTSAGTHWSTHLRAGAEQEKSRLIRQVVSSVMVQDDALQIGINKSALKDELLGAGREKCEGSITLQAPCHFAKRGAEVRLILASCAQHQSRPVPSLVRAVAQAKTWSEWIIKGEVSTMRQLAKRTGLHRKYVSRLLNLAMLSPDVTEAIFRGDHHPSLTVEQLAATLEIDWSKQKLPRLGEPAEAGRKAVV
jgi:hypothetical protein